MLTTGPKDYGFDYSDGDEADDSGTPDLENMYYSAKCEPFSCGFQL